MSNILNENGGASSTRVAMFAVLGTALFCITYCTVTGETLPELSPNWIWLVAVGMGAKVVQKFAEVRNDKTPTTTNPSP